MAEVANYVDPDVPAALHRDDGLLGRLAVGLEVDHPVDAGVGPLAATLVGLGADAGTSPELELVRITREQVLSGPEVARRADYLELGTGIALFQSAFD